METTVTMFKDVMSTSKAHYVDLVYVLDRIKTGGRNTKEKVLAIRKEKDKAKRNELKKQLPAICFSGEFVRRADDSIKTHSGVICLDFDGFKTKNTLSKFKTTLKKDKYVLSCFTSPSGEGVKALVKIPRDIEYHKRYFDALKQHFNSEHFDKSCSNISRVCYESYDDSVYVNLDSELWDTKSDLEYQQDVPSTFKEGIPINDESKIITILRSWWDKNHGFVDGERNKNIFILASAFNDYGVGRMSADAYMSQFAQRDFPMPEIKMTVDSAYRNTSAHGSKIFLDENKYNDVKKNINRGLSKVDVVNQNKDIPEDVIEAIYDNTEKTSLVKRFWNKSNKGKIELDHFMFKKFLEQEGFFKHLPKGSSDYVFVKVFNNLIHKVTVGEIKDYVLDYVRNTKDYDIYNYFADKTRYFKEDFLSMIKSVDVRFVRDSSDSAYIYYLNCAVLVTSDNIEKVDYIDLDGYIWSDQVVDRNFYDCSAENSVFSKFIDRVSNNDEERKLSIESTIGYLLSSYKDPRFSPAVILNDEVMTDNPEGGTGKGLFVKAIGHLKKIYTINAKKFNMDNQFAFQKVESDTQVISFDDIKKNFDFEGLFSIITEGIEVEKKNRDSMVISYEDSPKIIITTNYAIKGKGNSFERRKWELEFHKHYNKDFTPADEFGKRFFDDWNEDEWCSFDNYMVNCLQFFLAGGFYRAEFSNLPLRRLGAETSQEFIEWCGLVPGTEKSDALAFGRKLHKSDLYNDFVTMNPDYRAKLTISRQKFNTWVSTFISFKDYDFAEGRDAGGKWIQIMDNEKKEDKEGPATLAV